MHGYIIFVVFIYAFYETQPNTKRNQELNQDKAINCEKQIVLFNALSSFLNTLSYYW